MTFNEMSHELRRIAALVGAMKFIAMEEQLVEIADHLSKVQMAIVSGDGGVPQTKAKLPPIQHQQNLPVPFMNLN